MAIKRITKNYKRAFNSTFPSSMVKIKTFFELRLSSPPMMLSRWNLVRQRKLVKESKPFLQHTNIESLQNETFLSIWELAFSVRVGTWGTQLENSD